MSVKDVPVPPGEPDSGTEKPVLLITGASSGIGAATARLAADRYRLVLAARRRSALDDLAADLGDDGAALAVECDVTKWNQVEALAARALEEFGRIDAVFANAGFGATRGFLEESPEHWESMVLTNVLGPALTIRATLPHLLERGDGHYLITSSVAGRRALPGSLYSATKFAATTIGEALRQELRQMRENQQIKVTLIEPGITDTEFFDDKPAEWALRDEDIAREVLHALTAPPGVEINEILIRPTAQRG
jgi:NADP-dependent 3-hydroxy acid dehydrogenase YdfG